MEQQTMTGSGLYIFIAVQLLFSMLILLRIRQYRKSRQAACRPFSSSSPQQASRLCCITYGKSCVMKTTIGQTSAECLPQAPGRSGWHGHFSDCSLCCSLLQAAHSSGLPSPVITPSSAKKCAELIGMILIPFLTLALLAASTLCISLSGMTLFTWLFSGAAFSDVAMLVLSAALFTFGYMGLLAFLFKFNGSKLDAYIFRRHRAFLQTHRRNQRERRQTMTTLPLLILGSLSLLSLLLLNWLTWKD